MTSTNEVTTLALLNLIRLLAAELVAGEHRDDVAKLVQALDRQLDSTPLPRGTDVNDARAGIAHARDLLRPYVKRVCDLADAAQARDNADVKDVNRVKDDKDVSGRAFPRTKYLQ